MDNSHYMVTGSYTSATNDVGIHVFKFLPDSLKFVQVSLMKSSNASFLAISPDQEHVYAVNENAPGTVSSYSFDRNNGQLTFLNSRPSLGDHPCYITTSSNGKWLILGNYSSGNFALYKLAKNGEIVTAVQSINHYGSSVNNARQQSPHVHSTVLSADNKFLVVPDLGIDKLMLYRFDQKKGRITPANPAFHMVEAGHGPRHFVFSPDNKFGYLVEELSGSISAYQFRKGELTLIQNISTLAGDFSGLIGSADIHITPDGNFLYATNRGGSNDIAMFKRNSATGMLQHLGNQPVFGKSPRNFSIHPSCNFLFVANQNSNEIVVFRINKETGLLEDTKQRISVPKPVCIQWIRK